jgi:hypothetical protein
MIIIVLGPINRIGKTVFDCKWMKAQNIKHKLFLTFSGVQNIQPATIDILQSFSQLLDLERFLTSFASGGCQKSNSRHVLSI